MPIKKTTETDSKDRVPVKSQNKATPKRSSTTPKASKSATQSKSQEKKPIKKPDSKPATKRRTSTEKVLDPWRPTKYKPEYCQMMLDYFNIEVHREVEVEVKPGVFEKRHITNTFPTITRFASKIGVSRDTLYEWASKKDEKGNLVHQLFSDTLTRCQDLQESLMVEGGLSGAYESRVLVFMAPNLTRLKNKVESVAEVALTVTSTEKLNEIYDQKMAEIKSSAAAASGRYERLGLNQK
ncbi:terminase small subunit [Undibacterium crateris]|uniref:terminase small subunit n=1 Tax=Undibacterium crateris TaxID=2528175 RepID=UPI001389E3A7|nr:terminase small subunit [Undibacterium crateris]NDI85106.1 hypothetical protein [Undibacterium crateris]